MVYTLQASSQGKNPTQYKLIGQGFPMIQASNLGGKQICAVKMDSSFKDINRGTLDINARCNTGFK